MKTRTRLILAAVVIVILLLLILVSAMEDVEGQSMRMTVTPLRVLTPISPVPTPYRAYLPLVMK